MHVQGNRRSSPIRLFVHSFEVVGAKGVIPNRGRRVARVPGARAVVSSKKFFAHTEFFAHLVQAWVGERHGIRASTRLNRGFRVGDSRLLACFDEKLGVFDGRVLQDSMSEI